MNEPVPPAKEEPCQSNGDRGENLAVVARPESPRPRSYRPLPAPPAPGTPNPARLVMRGRVLMLLSALAFAAMGLSVKLVPPEIGSHEKVFFRSLIGFVALVAYLHITGRMPARPRNVGGLIWRGVYGAAALLLFFYSIDQAGLVKATLYGYTYPVFAVVFAWLDLGERPVAKVLGAVALALAGTILTVDMDGWRPHFSTGDLAGLVSGVLSGAAVTSIRKLRRTEHSAWIVIAFTVAGIVFSLPMTIADFTLPRPAAMAMLVAMGLLALLAQMLMTMGYRYLSAVEGSVLGQVTVPVSAILGMLLLGETLSARFWVGAGLVFTAMLVLCIQMARGSGGDGGAEDEVPAEDAAPARAGASRGPVASRRAAL